MNPPNPTHTLQTEQIAALTVTRIWEYPAPAIPLRAVYHALTNQLYLVHPARLPVPDPYHAAVARYELARLLAAYVQAPAERLTLWLVGYPDPSYGQLNHQVRVYHATRVSPYRTDTEPVLLAQLEPHGLLTLPRYEFREATPIEQLLRYAHTLRSQLYSEPQPPRAFLLMPEQISFTVNENDHD